MDPADTAPTWYWRIEPSKLREAAEIRRRDPNDFASAVLTFFGFGGRDDGAAIAKMRAHPEGRRVLEERIPLPAGIMRPEIYASLPEDTLGHEYWKHCVENGLDPMLISTQSQAVAKRYPATPDHAFVYDRYRDSHDLWHVLTGYGTDMAGEYGIIALQTRQAGYRAMAITGFVSMLLTALAERRPDMIGTWFEGRRRGRDGVYLLVEDWESLVERPLHEVREQLRFAQAPDYRPFDYPRPEATPARAA